MQVGSFKQKADWFLIGFVFGCVFIIIILLIALQRSEAKAQGIDSVSLYYKYNPD